MIIGGKKNVDGTLLLYKLCRRNPIETRFIRNEKFNKFKFNKCE